MALSMSVRQTESYVQGLINPEAKEKKESKADAQPQDPNVREAQDRLRRTLGLKVRIEDKNGKGRVIIEYSGLEDFDSILTASRRTTSPLETRHRLRSDRTHKFRPRNTRRPKQVTHDSHRHVQEAAHA